MQEFLAEGVILYASKGNVIRLLPPLIIGKEEVDIFLEIATRYSRGTKNDEEGFHEAPRHHVARNALTLLERALS